MPRAAETPPPSLTRYLPSPSPGTFRHGGGGAAGPGAQQPPAAGLRRRPPRELPRRRQLLRGETPRPAPPSHWFRALSVSAAAPSDWVSWHSPTLSVSSGAGASSRERRLNARSAGADWPARRATGALIGGARRTAPKGAGLSHVGGGGEGATGAGPGPPRTGTGRGPRAPK